MDKMLVCGTSAPGSIPGGSTNEIVLVFNTFVRYLSRRFRAFEVIFVALLQ